MRSDFDKRLSVLETLAEQHGHRAELRDMTSEERARAARRYELALRIGEKFPPQRVASSSWSPRELYERSIKEDPAADAEYRRIFRPHPQYEAAYAAALEREGLTEGRPL